MHNDKSTCANKTSAEAFLIIGIVAAYLIDRYARGDFVPNRAGTLQLKDWGRQFNSNFRTIQTDLSPTLYKKYASWFESKGIFVQAYEALQDLVSQVSAAPIGVPVVMRDVSASLYLARTLEDAIYDLASSLPEAQIFHNIFQAGEKGQSALVDINPILARLLQWKNKELSDDVFKYIDRMADVAPESGDSAEKILADFLGSVRPIIDLYTDLKDTLNGRFHRGGHRSKRG